MEDQRATVARIQAENHKIGAGGDIPINYVGWLCSPKRAAGSVVVEFMNAEHANLALQTGLIWDSEYKKTELYDRACRIQECFKCHKYGHISAQCGGTQKCGICAEGHRSEDCPSKDLGSNTRKCASCGGPHKARDNKCPEFQKETARVQVARNTKQTRWRVPTRTSVTKLKEATPSKTANGGASEVDTNSHSKSTNSGNRDNSGSSGNTSGGATPTPHTTMSSGHGTTSGPRSTISKILTRIPSIPTPAPKAFINGNGKRPVSPTKTATTDANRTPLGPVDGNRPKRTTIRSLKMREADAAVEAAASHRSTRSSGRQMDLENSQATGIESASGQDSVSSLLISQDGPTADAMDIETTSTSEITTTTE